MSIASVTSNQSKRSVTGASRRTRVVSLGVTDTTADIAGAALCATNATAAMATRQASAQTRARRRMTVRDVTDECGWFPPGRQHRADSCRPSRVYLGRLCCAEDSMRMLFVLVPLLMGPALLAGQSAPPAAADQRPRFDAASVTPNRSPQAGINNQFSPGRFAYVNTPLEVFIYNAYGVRSDRVVGMPDWARQDKFDITATHSPEYRSFSQQQNQMLQRLLEERFSLRIHRETREMPVYELVKARTDDQLGPQLRVATLDCSPAANANRSQCGLRINTGLIDGKSVDWRILVGQLPNEVGRAVICLLYTSPSPRDS